MENMENIWNLHHTKNHKMKETREARKEYRMLMAMQCTCEWEKRSGQGNYLGCYEEKRLWQVCLSKWESVPESRLNSG